MTFVAACLLVALGCAGLIIVCLVLGIYDTRVALNEANDDADRLDRQLEATQAELDAALRRLSRKPKRIAALSGEGL